MFKKVTYYTYIGKSKIAIIKEGKVVNPNTIIGELAYPNLPDFQQERRAYPNIPDYYLRGLYIKPTEDDPGEFFQMVKPFEKCTHYMYVTGIPKEVPSLKHFKLRDCIWSSYYEDDYHGYLFQICPITTK